MSIFFPMYVSPNKTIQGKNWLLGCFPCATWPHFLINLFKQGKNQTKFSFSPCKGHKFIYSFIMQKLNQIFIHFRPFPPFFHPFSTSDSQFFIHYATSPHNFSSILQPYKKKFNISHDFIIDEIFILKNEIQLPQRIQSQAISVPWPFPHMQNDCVV